MRARQVFAMTLAAVSLLFSLYAPVATAGASGLKARRAWVSLPLLPDEPAQAYFSLQNAGREARKLVGARSPRAERVEIHSTVFADGEETTEKLKEWEVPSGGAAIFAPGGVALVLYGPKDLKEGEKIQIELEFGDGTKLPMEALVRDE